jgi:hypothetical protein
MHQVEVEFPEYDFRAFLSSQATGMKDSDVEEGGGGELAPLDNYFGSALGECK